ncbi:hypothetical protein [Streptomyces brevispora]|uniref:hypothetical protein n=1 Tax=Streptomyces brevispora TaxID=887462 RepID=UPI002DDAF249|nr:hypothetical protein [Streptomyces brevispora]
MTNLLPLRATRAYCDTVAEDYAERVRGAFAQDVWGRAMLGGFAEEVRADGGLPVADLGCGPRSARTGETAAGGASGPGVGP